MMINNEDIPVIDIKIGDKTYKAVSYYWDNNDFYFTTEEDENFCCENAYPTSIVFDVLDYKENDICVIENNNIYTKNF